LWETVALNGDRLDATAYASETQPLEVQQNLRFQGQYLDRESGLHYNTFRFYDPDFGRFISPDPIGLDGGWNLQTYASNHSRWIDPWGLTPEPAPGYTVYHIYEVDPNTGQRASKPYYVGITEDGRFNGRMQEHQNSGRLPKSGAVMVAQETGLTYGQARGTEQAHIEHFKTNTGTVGADMSKAATAAERGNRVNGYDVSSKLRAPGRQTYFNNARAQALKKTQRKVLRMNDSVFKQKNIKNIHAGDIFAFRMDDGQYGFGRIVSRISEGHIAEIFNHFSSEPKFDTSKTYERFLPPIILNSYGMFQVKQDGDFGIVGSTPNYAPDAEISKFKFVFGSIGNFKSIDIFGTEVPIGDAEGLRLPLRSPFNDWFLKKYIEHALKGEVWPKPGIAS
jgi:RHS repeat-associated protein